MSYVCICDRNFEAHRELAAHIAAEHPDGGARRGEPARRAGEITYHYEYGHVCRCTETVLTTARGEPVNVTYEPTVRVARDVAPTESGSWFYVCERCGAGTWSGC